MSINSVRRPGNWRHSERGRGHWLRGAAWLAAAVLVLAGCGGQQLGGTESAVLIVEDASSTPAGLLDASVVAGEITIVADTRPRATEVHFYLDDRDMLSDPTKVDTEDPFDLTLHTTDLSEGLHTVTALVMRVKGKSESLSVVEAQFTIDNDGSETPEEDPPAEPDPEPDPEPEPDPGVEPIVSPSPSTSLRASPDFDESLLGGDARIWHRRVWAAIENPNARYDLFELAATGNLRNYGYDFNQQMSLLFTAVRATQNPEFVDLIANLADVMADQMVTKWYDHDGNRWYTPDDGTAGYRRFLYDHNDSKYNGTDAQTLSAVLAHGMIANMTYVLEANRGVRSPSGIDYGAKADFWKDYLRNDFEAIWRIRTGKSWPSFPLWTHQVAHSFKSQMRWAFYMYKLTGDTPYLESAQDYADDVLRNTYRLSTPLGDALVWSHLIKRADYGLQPISYSRYEYGIEVDLVLEGGLNGIDRTYMQMHARTFAHFVMDNGATDLAFDVGGMRSRTGSALKGGASATLPSRDPWTGSGLTWGRESTNRYVLSYFAPLALFDGTGEIESVSQRIYEDKESDLNNPRNLAIPVGMLLVERLR